MLEQYFQSPQYIIAQIIGLIALVFGVICFSQRDDHKMKLWAVAQCLALVPHFLLLGAHVAVFSVLISATRNYLSTKLNMRKVAPLFLVFYIGFGYWKYHQWYDLLPTIGAICSTIGLFYLRQIPMRLTFLTSTTLWLIHNIAIGSIGPSIMELLQWFANARTIYRIKQHKPVTNAPPATLD